ncbi:unnamed protein product [Vitrella brassicaformis CCMP3155]|uniref:Uncharacterized protein n=1 Tax=Vitrella brassicaformis (strain CCMP3155) TaxID=1169540 RepID=A0A0G4G7X9_VITBC|nr:unnamed protein product [Vitrella brassicaformis CCMP3155]|eukprot:CEM24841.1 unnamed protein product [Vitrella brassicaformis CCMP3155]
MKGQTVLILLLSFLQAKALEPALPAKQAATAALDEATPTVDVQTALVAKEAATAALDEGATPDEFELDDFLGESPSPSPSLVCIPVPVDLHANHPIIQEAAAHILAQIKVPPTKVLCEKKKKTEKEILKDCGGDMTKLQELKDGSWVEKAIVVADAWWQLRFGRPTTFAERLLLLEHLTMGSYDPALVDKLRKDDDDDDGPPPAAGSSSSSGVSAEARVFDGMQPWRDDDSRSHKEMTDHFRQGWIDERLMDGTNDRE